MKKKLAGFVVQKTGRFCMYSIVVASACGVFNGAFSASIGMPFNGCTFYKTRLVAESFAMGTPWLGCSDFSAVNGRNGCRKIKGKCPFCYRYRGDHVQMWLPDYFIEVTKHVGRSVFAESADGKLLAAQLALGAKWWGLSSVGIPVPMLSNGSQSISGGDSFWHARILTVPYGSFASNYPPLGASKGVGLPACFSAASEFIPAQWNTNLADGPFALLWAPIGVPLCLSPNAALSMGAVEEAKAKVSSLAGSAGGTGSLPVDLACANPVGAKEAFYKNALPSSDALAPFRGEISSGLCMGTWGNLLPRTGWIASEDPHMSAMMAAYKFQSAAGDFHLNPQIKLQSDDKWQIVYPPRLLGKCFRPGSPFKDLPPASEEVLSRSVAEATPGSAFKNHTYIIAVWRKRESCEEPLQWFDGWNTDFKANFHKNQALCRAAGAF